MATRPAKIAGRDRDSGKNKACPSCNNPKMNVVKMVRHSKSSGFFWMCEKCNYEQSTR